VIPEWSESVRLIRHHWLSWLLLQPLSCKQWITFGLLVDVYFGRGLAIFTDWLVQAFKSIEHSGFDKLNSALFFELFKLVVIFEVSEEAKLRGKDQMTHILKSKEHLFKDVLVILLWLYKVSSSDKVKSVLELVWEVLHIFVSTKLEFV